MFQQLAQFASSNIAPALLPGATANLSEFVQSLIAEHGGASRLNIAGLQSALAQLATENPAMGAVITDAVRLKLGPVTAGMLDNPAYFSGENNPANNGFKAGGGNFGGGGASGSWETQTQTHAQKNPVKQSGIITAGTDGPEIVVIGTRPAPETNGPYGRYQTLEGLQRAASAQYQDYVDDAYAIAKQRLEEGELKPGLNDNQRIGVFVDDISREQMREWFEEQGVEVGKGELAEVYVNQRLYNNDGTAYRIPDLRVGDRIFDATLSEKTLKNSQIREFFAFGNPISVTIVRPSQIGTSYDIQPPIK